MRPACLLNTRKPGAPDTLLVPTAAAAAPLMNLFLL